jgi:hypothetical protein
VSSSRRIVGIRKQACNFRIVLSGISILGIARFAEATGSATLGDSYLTILATGRPAIAHDNHFFIMLGG